MSTNIKNKVLVSFCSYNQPHFLEHLVDSIDRHDAGHPFDLLIYDNSSTDKEQLKLLEKYSKKYRVETRPNYGRAQGAYNDAWQNNKDYKLYFFLHDDSAIIRDNWLGVAAKRIEGIAVESVLQFNGLPTHLLNVPVGKVGYQAYEWGNKYQYFRTHYPQVFKYMDPIADILDVKIPEMYQHINDDKILYKNELLQKMGKIWNIEDFKKMELNNDERWHKIDKWFIDNNLENYDPFPPNERYGPKYHKFQTVSEFLNDIAPMRYGYRTHCVEGEGYCQEHEGWNNFRGNNYIVHYGDHVVFKRLSLLLNQPEQAVRNKFKDKIFLQICDNIIKKNSNAVKQSINNLRNKE